MKTTKVLTNFKIYISLALEVLVSSFFFVSYAYDCSSLPSDLEDAPNIASIVCILGRVFNLAILVVGGILVFMIGYGIWKSSMALGDPKALASAKQTWTYAIIGFFIVVAFFAIFGIILQLLGLPVLTPADLMTRLEENITNLQDIILHGN